MSISANRRYPKKLTKNIANGLTSLQRENKCRKRSVKASPLPLPSNSKTLPFTDSFKNPDSLIKSEALTIKTSAISLAKGLKEKLLEFKASNNEFLLKKQKKFFDLEDCRNEFEFISDSISSVVSDTYHGRSESKLFNSQLRNRSYSKIEAYSLHEFQSPIAEHLESLKNVISGMNQRLSNTEMKIASKCHENEILKDSIYKLKESITDKTLLEQESALPACQICIIS